jgi:chromate transport protein ChrA
MKELIRMFVYVVPTVAVIFFMIWLTRQEGMSDNFMVGVAILLVIIIPVVIGVVLARRERQQRDRESERS